MGNVDGRKFTEKNRRKRIRRIKAVLGMLARGTEARKYGPMAEEAGSACDCKTKH